MGSRRSLACAGATVVALFLTGTAQANILNFTGNLICSAKGLALSCSPFSTGFCAGFNDKVVNMFHTASSLGAEIGCCGAPSHSGLYQL